MKYANDEEIVIDTKKILIKENLSQKELAEKIGVSEWTVSRHLGHKTSLGKSRNKYIEFNAMYGYNGSHEPIFDEPDDVTGCNDVYKMMSIEELTEKIEFLKGLRAEKIQAEIKSIESEITSLYEKQDKYEKLLKGEEDQA